MNRRRRRSRSGLARLLAHPRGTKLGRLLTEHLDEALMHLLPSHQGLIRVGPEWLWRDFRRRLGRGRNHGSPQRLERAALLWSIYHNFTPAQWRSEHKRKYKHPGQNALEVAGATPGRLSYLDAWGSCLPRPGPPLAPQRLASPCVGCHNLAHIIWNRVRHALGVCALAPRSI